MRAKRYSYADVAKITFIAFYPKHLNTLYLAGLLALLILFTFSYRYKDQHNGLRIKFISLREIRTTVAGTAPGFNGIPF